MKTQSINFYRGESTSVSLEIQGNHLLRDLVFVVKAGTQLSLPRLIEKCKSRNEIVIDNYNTEENISVIKIFFSPEDTADLKVMRYAFDIDSIGNDSSDRNTCVYGNFNLTADVQTPYDGFETPETATRFITISAEEGNVGDVVQIQLNSNNEKVFKLVPLIELKSQLNNI